jgi:DNA mismatch repair protein MutS2
MMLEENFLEKLEFGKILQMLAERTYSPGGRELALALRPITNIDQVAARLDQTQDAMDLLHFGEPGFLSLLKPVEKHLAKAKMGGILAPLDLMDIYHLLRDSRLAVKYVSSSSGQGILSISSQIKPDLAVEKQIAVAIDEEGFIRDDASVELRNIRKSIESSRQRIKEYLQNFIRSGNNQNLLQDAIITERAGRYVVPVKQEHRYEVKGIVHDESASGATVFIEPLAVVDQNNKIKSMQIEEKREVERILNVLSASVAVIADEQSVNYAQLCCLDLLFAKAHLAFDLNAFRPDINDKGVIDLIRARHPLLGDDAVPVNITLGKNYDIMVITGPNTGGKTVVLKTIGLLTVMAMSGMFVPAREKSQVSVFDSIFVDIGDEQSIEQSLSTFSSHMQNIIYILQKVKSTSLVLLDELGAGTDPVEGAALARAILELLLEKRARVVITTHQSELKTFAYQNERVENACVEFDPLTLRPTYELTIGTPGQSNAFEIASRLGLDKSIVNQARKLVPEREMEIGNMIRQLRESRFQFELRSQELEQGQRQLRADLDSLEQEKQNFYQAKDHTLQKAKQEADQYVRRIKREAAEAIDELKDLLKDKQNPPKWHEVEKKNKRIKELAVNTMGEDESEPMHAVSVGDYVTVKSVNQKGYVVEAPIGQEEVTVQIGSIKLTVSQEQLQPAKKDKETKRAERSQVFLAKTQSISSELDLRGKYAEDALAELDKYLEDANLAGIDKVRIIHGKGTGALRLAVREYLKGHRYVKDYRDGMREEGGYGVTVVNLN